MSTNSTIFTPTVLTIAGSDSYGGAGIQADIKTIHANNGYAFSAITALTAQNSQGVHSVNIVDASILKSQLDAILSDIKVDAIKIGMLGNREIVEVVIDTIERYNLKNIVLDTVIVSSSGATLLDSCALDVFKNRLIPIADIITPNLLEINTLTQKNFKGLESEIDAICDELFSLRVKSALIKGGHFQDRDNSIDILIQRDKEKEIFISKRVDTTHTHGTGCTLSSAIATNLAKGETLSKSIQLSKKYLTNAMENSFTLKFKYIDNSVEKSEPIKHFL
jgi:hydroxymethylpyrimidine/phosphomethylpyrimidine kinase